jgi:hypothetical protein
MFYALRKNRTAAIQIFSNTGQDEAWKTEEAARPFVEGKIPSEFPKCLLPPVPTSMLHLRVFYEIWIGENEMQMEIGSLEKNESDGRADMVSNSYSKGSPCF